MIKFIMGLILEASIGGLLGIGLMCMLQPAKGDEKDIGYYINQLPEFEKPIKIHFTWIEENKRRDLDNVCFAKKFILDSLVKAGKLKNDNRNYVQGFEDSFEYAKESKVILEIKEL